MRGRVADDGGEPLIALQVRDGYGRDVQIEAVIDTSPSCGVPRSEGRPVRPSRVGGQQRERGFPGEGAHGAEVTLVERRDARSPQPRGERKDASASPSPRAWCSLAAPTVSDTASAHHSTW